MAVMLDTSSLEAADRAEALRSALDAVVGPTRLEVAAEVQATLAHWQMASDLRLVRFAVRADAVKLRRSPAPRLHQSDGERLSVAVNSGGFCLTTSRASKTSDNGRLRILDLTSEYGIAYRGECRTVAGEVEYASLDLSVDQARRAVSHIHASPLHDLVRRHLLELSRTANDLSAATLPAVGVATVTLIRALVRSVSPRDSERRQAMESTLIQRIEHYVREHLGDPELTLAGIAAHHNISLRRLHRMLAGRAETPGQWIITSRLAAAREELAHNRAGVSTVARNNGFKDHSHFTRRFKAEYGITPADFMLRTRESSHTAVKDVML